MLPKIAVKVEIMFLVESVSVHIMQIRVCN